MYTVKGQLDRSAQIKQYQPLVRKLAHYMMAKLPVDDVEKFLIFLLTEFEDNGETVMFAPAEGFYATEGLGNDEMRIAYVLNKDAMRRGVELIRLGLEAYNSK